MLTCNNRNFFHCPSSVSSLLLLKVKIIISDTHELSHKKKTLKINEHRFYNFEVVVKVLVVIKNRKKKEKNRHWFFLGLLAE